MKKNMKSILVIDTPECCSKCRHSYDGSFCLNVDMPNDAVIGGRMWKEIRTKEKPDWCPLKPMPEKKDYYGTYAQGYSEYEAQYWDGYNDCIDDILGEEGRNRHEGETR